MNITLHTEVISKFRQWYDAVWLGDDISKAINRLADAIERNKKGIEQ